jgi:glycosyltransferase involved in cell wall biosynthesis
MTHTIVVSVIIPVFNAAKTIEATIASVLRQTLANFEIIAVNDGSTDESLQTLLRLAVSDSRVRVVSQDNRGVAATRNFGVSLAKGSLLAFLDADDIWHSDKLARHFAFHDSDTDIDASYARIAFVDAVNKKANKPRTTSSVRPGCLSVQDLFAENPVCTMSNLVVRRDVFQRVGDFREDMSFAEDQEWLARAASRWCTIEGIDEVLVDYRLSPDGLSVNLDRMYEGWRIIAQEHAGSINTSGAEAVYCRYLARRALRAGAPARTAWDFAMRGLRLDPQSFLGDAHRGWLTLLAAFAARIFPRRARLIIFA